MGKTKSGKGNKTALHFFLLIIVVGIVVFNQVQINSLAELASGGKSVNPIKKSFSKATSLFSGEKGGKIIGPMINPDGKTTKLVEYPTISETPPPKDTGDPTQDAIKYIIPTGTPFYVESGPGSEKIQGATFDDPIASQKIWASLLGSKRFGTENTIELTAEEEQRWKKITGSFTCDYCCGGPNSVTIINRCGCAHSYGWQGMAKFFIKYYPEKTDEESMGEMTKWKGLWYPQGMIQDYLVYTGQASPKTLRHGGSVGIIAQFADNGAGGEEASTADLGNLPSMVGGC